MSIHDDAVENAEGSSEESPLNDNGGARTGSGGLPPELVQWMDSSPRVGWLLVRYVPRVWSWLAEKVRNR